MKRFALTIIIALLALVNYAQLVSDAELTAIRAAYSEAKQLVELNSQAQEQDVPRSDMEVVSHYVIPGCGPTEEVIRYYFTVDEDPEEGICIYKPYLITRSYNVAARKFYQEFLFDQEASLLFFYQSNDAMDGTTDETRYYYGKHGVHQSIKGAASMDEVFAARLADDLKTAFHHLLNRDY